MSDDAFVILLLVGAAAIALWFEMRFPALVPVDIARMTRHIVLAVFALVVITPVGTQMVQGLGESGAFTLAALFAVALPILTYSMLVTIWVIRLAQALIGR